MGTGKHRPSRTPGPANTGASRTPPANTGRCDGCGEHRRGLVAMGQDVHGDPEPPDLCWKCRRAYTETRGGGVPLPFWVRRLRARLGSEHRPLSQRRLAERIGCSENAVIGWECWGRHPYPALARVLTELGASVGLAPWAE